MKNVIAVEDSSLSKKGKARFVIVDKETGEILDNAQGYGYKTKPKAYAGYAYLTRDKSKDEEKLARREHIGAMDESPQKFWKGNE